METVIVRIDKDSNVVDQSFDEWLSDGLSRRKVKLERVFECSEALVIDKNEIVMAAAKIRGIEKDFSGGTGRVNILADPLPNSQWVGKRILRSASRNPISYVQTVIEAAIKL